jgi:DNA-binding response OmpR family regulator
MSIGTIIALINSMSNSFQVLIISENPDTQEELKKNLARLGCKAKLINTAENGIEELKTISYDAIFADLCVREKGGRSIARWVKNESIQTKVFIVTSWKGELDPHLLQVDGIHAVIHKPFIFSEIRDKLLEHIG